MPDTRNPIEFKVGKYLTLEYKGIGTFVEIRNQQNGEFIWCDPWITDAYPLAREALELNLIKDYLKKHDAENKLKGILISHTHGDHFADVPAIMAELGGATHPPKVYGDANVQSLVCQYFAVDPRYRNNYGFYSGFQSAAFQQRELSLRGDIQDPGDRNKYGLAHDLAKMGDSFLLPDIADRNQPRYFYLRVTPVRWVHSSVPDIILGSGLDLSDDPGLRTKYVTDPTDTTCPSLHLYGFVFELFRRKRGEDKSEMRANFALIPGPSPDGEAAWKTFFEKTGDWAVPFNHFFYVPSAEDFIHGRKLMDGVNVKPLAVDGGKWNIFHTADGKL